MKKKMGRPVTTGTGKGVLIRFQSEQLAVIEDWIAQQESSM